MAIESFVRALYDAPFSAALRESIWTFPIVQTFHVIGILAFYGAIVIVDLRLLGVVLKERPAKVVADALLPLSWSGFAIMAVSGGLLFAAQSIKIYTNPMMIAKLGLIGFAGLNLAFFTLVAGRRIAEWGVEGGTTPSLARISAAGSLLLWTAVVITGRFIAYV